MSVQKISCGAEQTIFVAPLAALHPLAPLVYWGWLTASCLARTIGSFFRSDLNLKDKVCSIQQIHDFIVALHNVYRGLGDGHVDGGPLVRSFDSRNIAA